MHVQRWPPSRVKKARCGIDTVYASKAIFWEDSLLVVYERGSYHKFYHKYFHPPVYSAAATSNRSPSMFVRAFTVLAWSVAWVVAHPHCWIDQRAVDLDGGLDFCSTNDDAAYGVCCTDAEEEALSEGVEVVAASLTENCAAYYKEVCMHFPFSDIRRAEKERALDERRLSNSSFFISNYP